MDYTKTLETKRLILRKFSLEDAKSTFDNWASDKETTTFLAWEPHKNLDETKENICNWIKEYENGAYNWVVEIKDTHEIIGNICEQGKNLKHKTICLGYWYASKYWNKGYATEALRRVLEYLLTEQDFYLVEANHRSTNVASGRVMQKAGMKYDGTLRQRRINPDGKRGDTVFYSIIKSEI